MQLAKSVAVVDGVVTLKDKDVPHYNSDTMEMITERNKIFLKSKTSPHKISDVNQLVGGIMYDDNSVLHLEKDLSTTKGGIGSALMLGLGLAGKEMRPLNAWPIHKETGHPRKFYERLGYVDKRHIKEKKDCECSTCMGEAWQMYLYYLKCHGMGSEVAECTEEAANKHHKGPGKDRHWPHPEKFVPMRFMGKITDTEIWNRKHEKAICTLLDDRNWKREDVEVKLPSGKVKEAFLIVKHTSETEDVLCLVFKLPRK